MTSSNRRAKPLITAGALLLCDPLYSHRSLKVRILDGLAQKDGIVHRKFGALSRQHVSAFRYGSRQVSRNVVAIVYQCLAKWNADTISRSLEELLKTSVDHI